MGFQAYHLTHLEELEAEAIYVLREVAEQFERPVLLFSGGKDSAVLSHLARKAFWPGRLRMPLLHVDTGHNFPETIAFRDAWCAKIRADLRVARVQDSIDQGRVVEETGPFASRNALQSVTLLDALKHYGFDAAVGGARRDEEKARAKERFFSHRSADGAWEPSHQRLEPWTLLNGRKNRGEHFRIFPLSNWTEHDVWRYIQVEEVELPSLYFAHTRRVFQRRGMWLAETPFVTLQPDETLEERQVRFRTVGDATCTACVESSAVTIQEVISELATLKLSERGTRVDDQRSESAMEDRKRQGYF